MTRNSNSLHFLVLLILVLLLVSCENQPEPADKPYVYYCDVESVSRSHEGYRLVDSTGLNYMGYGKQDSTKAHEGVYSLLLDSANQYAFTMSVTDIRPGEVFTIECWQSVDESSKPCVLVAANKDNSFYHAENTIVKKAGEWSLIRTHVYIPSNYNLGPISFYVWNRNRDPTYVDDYRLIRYNHQTDHSAFQLDVLRIRVKKKGLEHMSAIRDSALKIGILKRGEDDYVSTKITYRGQKIDGKIRLKGDWTDHLIGDKWSFRIKLDEPMKDGLQTFNVQAPHTRDFLNEFVYHKLLESEDIMSPEYRFVQLYLNDVSLGIYAFEEHLGERMIVRSGKPAGIILKFDDKPYWDEMSKLPEDRNDQNIIARAEIKSYGKAKKEVESAKNIEEGKLVLQGYQKQDSLAYRYFDMNLMGKYYALSDVARAYHAMVWINIRFYYDFSKKRVEPVGYDGYTSAGPKDWAAPYLGYLPNHDKYSEFESEAIVYDVFRMPIFEDQYTEFLKEYTDTAYLTNALNLLKDELDFYESQIQIEYPHYRYDRMFLRNSADAIRRNNKDWNY